MRNKRTNRSGWRAQKGNKRGDRKTLGAFVLFAVVFLATASIAHAYMSGWLRAPNAMSLSWVGSSEPQNRDPSGAMVKFTLCHNGGGFNCVVDGDTIWLEGRKIRLADIDAPETHDYRCASEREIGDRATIRLREILQSGSIALQRIDRDTDQYGRQLRVVLVDGRSAGGTLVNEGLARWYASGRRPWC